MIGSEITITHLEGNDFLTIKPTTGKEIPFELVLISTSGHSELSLKFKYGQDQREFSHDGNYSSYKVLSVNGVRPDDLNHLHELINLILCSV